MFAANNPGLGFTLNTGVRGIEMRLMPALSQAGPTT
jgi:hypothetical protein